MRYVYGRVEVKDLEVPRAVREKREYSLYAKVDYAAFHPLRSLELVIQAQFNPAKSRWRQQHRHIESL